MSRRSCGRLLISSPGRLDDAARVHRGGEAVVPGAHVVPGAPGLPSRLLPLASPSGQNHEAEIALRARIVQIHEQSGRTYGAPRIAKQLRRDGVMCNRKRVARLMLAELVSGLRRPRFRRPHRASDDLPDLVLRGFHAAAPDVLWMADVTQIATREGWLFVAAVMDAFSRRIVGWAMGETVNTELVAEALDMAVTHRSPKRGLIHRSDRGGPYISIAFGDALRNSGIRQSVGAARTCFDNAAMESFFATLKKDLVYRRGVFNSR